MVDRPNIILIITDQQRHDTVAGLGAHWMKTPNLDRLVASGVSFRNCYTPSPLCVPARASLFTGMYPHSHHVTMNFYKWEPTWVRLLAEAGYHCVNIGKMHTNPYDAPGGFHQRIVVENKDRPMFLDEPERAYYDHWDIALRAQGMTRPTRYARYKRDPDYFKEALGAYPWEYDESMHPDTFVGRTACWWLEERQADAPLFLEIGFPGPHPPFDPPRRYIDMYDDVDVPMPRTTAAELAAQPPAHRALRQNMIDKNFDCVAWKNDPSTEAIRRMRRYYAANVTLIDEQVGNIMSVLERKGYLKNAIVIFTSDHGENLGDHGHIQKWNMYDTATKVPLVVWSSDLKTRDVRTDSLVQLMDIAPTILDYAGVGIPAGWEAVSLRPVLEDGTATVRDSVYSELYRDHIQSGAECIVMRRDARWKAVWYLGESCGELYDLEADPDELQNLWDSKQHVQIRNEFVQHIQDWLIRGAIENREQTREKPQPAMAIG
ncbi:sulfatase-like hydrolase/transferase [Bradyrhizobium sp. Arg237L]|uniref:sulfatase family protein n=1 Tax=Bradyrhizobium sp. Arg237L TaxID=3003352 RepID=UPI00249F2969|nr:sulfatase-like hydrolase/transferase [Bradyrhizobium sp. Arg237L]MDI4232592.1 sulfatase-like hydrolase/transferase [Bradyrhizobium sp. Arg237L]